MSTEDPVALFRAGAELMAEAMEIALRRPPPAPLPESPLLTTAEVGALMRLTRRGVDGLVARGALHKIALGESKAIRFRRDEVERLLSEGVK